MNHKIAKGALIGLCITVVIWIAAVIIACISLDIHRESEIKDEMGGNVKVTQCERAGPAFPALARSLINGVKVCVLLKI
ncbi:MAG: hypothetical protein HFE76_06240 [Firmicutes bacterium]|nr:hypothetical protein [Bacillota bacterium]